VLPQFKYLGIEFGKPWTRQSVKPLVLEQMKMASGQIGKMMIDSIVLGGRLADGWVIPSADIGMTGADYLKRALIAVFGLTANTLVEAIYYAAVLDDNEQPFTGAKRYTITFKKPMDYLEPVPVPLKLGNAGGGKGPQFKTDAIRGEGPGRLGNL
jgi:hypothetical protein